MGEPWRQNAACGEFFAGSCFSFFATSGVLMSGLFEGLPLLSDMYEFLAENRTPMCQSYTFQFWERLIVAVASSNLTDYIFFK